MVKSKEWEWYEAKLFGQIHMRKVITMLTSGKLKEKELFWIWVVD